jgi:hypothetical protein
VRFALCRDGCDPAGPDNPEALDDGKFKLYIANLGSMCQTKNE